MKFLLDTNFLLAVGQFKLDVFSELQNFGKPELYTLDLVVRELKKISGAGGKDSRHAKFALMLVEKKNVKILKTENENTDQEIERIASEESLTVCTQDRTLIRRLQAEDIDVIIIRQKKYLKKV